MADEIITNIQTILPGGIALVTETDSTFLTDDQGNILTDDQGNIIFGL